MQKLLSIIQLFANNIINTQLCMHANTVLNCKKHSKLLLLVYIVVSARYSMCYHITMKVCLEL